MSAVQAEEVVLDPVEAEGQGYRRVLLTHLTSWVQDATEVVTDPDRCDSASLEDALNEVNGVVFEIEMETERKPLGLEAEQLLVAAELMMRRARGYAGRDAKAQMRCSRAAAELANEAHEFYKTRNEE
ncbi:hypothetical protein [Streptomyces mutabilis]|uniref:Uncharacterized protein n=1 Tax=Streptomyces mutabilis TaxID=67332 RepID=A0A086MQH2_9ACTN|nr:hypothetical protein [Streptomyces mutabilis]KFG71140.1 hypothetical protein FM21_36350 [Streptomyces mutabilis]